MEGLRAISDEDKRENKGFAVKGKNNAAEICGRFWG